MGRKFAFWLIHLASRRSSSAVSVAFLASFLSALPAQASSGASQIAVSLPNSAILIEHDADAPRRPASLVKLMTGYIAFEALRDGEITEDELVAISKQAAHQPPVKLHLRADEKANFGELLSAAMVGSKNDAAVAVAEAIAGSEENFVGRMNRTAKRLGLKNTNYRSATGLPREGQVTTARDVALLAQSLLRDFPVRSRLFSQRSVRAKGRAVSTTNPLFGRVAGSMGMKTGFTCAAGYSIAALIEREGGQILAVTMGHSSKSERLDKARRLISAAKEIPRGNNTLSPASVVNSDEAPDIRACSGRGAEIVATDIPLPVDADLYLAGITAAPRALEMRGFPAFPPLGEGSAPLEPAESFSVLRPRSSEGARILSPLPAKASTVALSIAPQSRFEGHKRSPRHHARIGPDRLPAQPKVPEPALAPPPPLYGWASYLGPQRSKKDANALMARITQKAGPAKRHAQMIPRQRDAKPLAVIYGLSKDAAAQHCHVARSLGAFCLTLSPARLTNERARWRR